MLSINQVIIYLVVCKLFISYLSFGSDPSINTPVSAVGVFCVLSVTIGMFAETNLRIFWILRH